MMDEMKFFTLSSLFFILILHPVSVRSIIAMVASFRSIITDD